MTMTMVAMMMLLTTTMTNDDDDDDNHDDDHACFLPLCKQTVGLFFNNSTKPQTPNLQYANIVLHNSSLKIKCVLK